jgi:hypothetical protein
VRRPCHDGLEQLPARAADVEEAAVAVDRLDDRAPTGLPPRLVTAEPGLRTRVVGREIGALVDLGH